MIRKVARTGTLCDQDRCLLRNLGDVLRIHHCFSRQSLSKDRFEYALEKTLGLCGRSATLAASSTNRGHDITIEGVPFSLKTQAAACTHIHDLSGCGPVRQLRGPRADSDPEHAGEYASAQRR